MEAANILEQVRKRLRRGESLEMANVATLDFLRNLFESSHNTARQDAQVDAMLRAKYRACGMEDVYHAPDREDDDMQIIMNSVITDKKTLSKVAEAASEKKTPWWLPAVGAGLLAAGLTAYFMRPNNTDTQNTVRPSNPDQIIDMEATNGV